MLVQKDGTEGQIESLNDRVEALTACHKRYVSETAPLVQGLEGLCRSIESLFSDDNPGVWLSTIHRAKGLESDRVLFLERDKLPLAWQNQRFDQYEQEKNLLYVGLTRAKKELINFGKPPTAKQEKLPEPPKIEVKTVEITPTTATPHPLLIPPDLTEI